MASKNVALYQRSFQGGKAAKQWRTLLHEEEQLQSMMMEVQEEEVALQDREAKLLASYGSVEKDMSDESARLDAQDHDLTLEFQRLEARKEEVAKQQAALDAKHADIDRLKQQLPGIAPSEKPRLHAMISQTQGEARKLSKAVESANVSVDEWTQDLKIRKRKVLDRREVTASKGLTMRHQLLKVRQKQHRLKARRYDLEEQGLALETEKLDIELGFNDDAVAHIEDADSEMHTRMEQVEAAQSSLSGAGRKLNAAEEAALRTLKVEHAALARALATNAKKRTALDDVRAHLDGRIEETKSHFMRLERARRRWARKNAKFHEDEKEIMAMLRNKGQSQVECILRAQYEMGGLHPFVAMKFLELSSLDWFIYDF